MADYRERAFDGVDLHTDLGDGPHTFTECSFVEAFAEDTSLAASRFDRCDLTGAELLDCDLTKVTFAACTGERTEFSGCDLADATFDGCTLVDARFARCSIAATRWTASKLLSVTFEQTAGLGWDISDCSLMYGDLTRFDFEGKTLRGVDLSEADLTGARFDKAVFEDCRLRGANWKGATFAGADLRGADLGPLEDAASLVALKGAIVSEAQSRAIIAALGLQVIE